MAYDVSAHSVHTIRRRDRAVEDETWIRALLHRAPMLTLATVDPTSMQPFLNTNIFVYDEAAHAIYIHTARVGRTPANITAHPRVCLTVSEMGRLLPAEVAIEFSVEYASVVVFGQASISGSTPDEQHEAAHALQLLLDKYFPHLQAGSDYRPPIAEELVRTAVYRIAIEEWSGKQKQVAPDFPGAFWYGTPPE